MYVFIAPPSVHELEKRLKGRGTENESSLRGRLEAARREMEWGMKGKLSGVDVVIVNDDVERAYGELKRAIFEQKSC